MYTQTDDTPHNRRLQLRTTAITGLLVAVLGKHLMVLEECHLHILSLSNFARVVISIRFLQTFCSCTLNQSAPRKTDINDKLHNMPVKHAAANVHYRLAAGILVTSLNKAMWLVEGALATALGLCLTETTSGVVAGVDGAVMLNRWCWTVKGEVKPSQGRLSCGQPAIWCGRASWLCFSFCVQLAKNVHEYK